jgi:UTP--glucose-1-phosphate uridylyltransferase
MRTSIGNNMIKKCIIPVGGYGTRFLPVTKSVPKTMLPIIDKPVIHYLVEEAILSGITDIAIILRHRDVLIEDYFNQNKPLEKIVEGTTKKESLNNLNEVLKGINITYIYEKKQEGSASAINLAKKFIGKDSFAIIFGDDFFISKVPPLKQMIKLYNEKHTNVIGSYEVPYDSISSYGILLHQNYKVTKLIEKPQTQIGSNLAVTGRYILSAKLFDSIKQLKPGINNEYQLTDAIVDLMKREDLYTCKLEGTYYDIGSKSGFIKANIAYALIRDDLKKEIKDYILKTYE